MITTDQVRDYFLQLIQVDSLSGQEAEVAALLRRDLEELGCEVTTDQAHESISGQCGNVIGRLAGSAEAPPLLLNAHMDTVAPGQGVTPVLDGDIIRTDGTTVLGGDDKGGCTAVILALRHLREEGWPHGPLEVVFTISEETGLYGAKALDCTQLRAHLGVVAESGALGKITVGAPYANKIDAAFIGRRAHAGLCPERGLNAIAAASKAIAAMQLGRLDEETTANIGVIRGGDARNVVPERCEIEGGARSHQEAKLEGQTRHMLECLKAGAGEVGATVEPRVERAYNGFRLPDDAAAVRLVRAAAERVGLQTAPLVSGGGSDANVFNERGIETVIIPTGPQEVHTTGEWVDVNDLHRACLWVAGIVRCHAAGVA
jgi:tripeptide aminopeptidase